MLLAVLIRKTLALLLLLWSSKIVESKWKHDVKVNVTETWFLLKPVIQVNGSFCLNDFWYFISGQSSFSIAP